MDSQFNKATDEAREQEESPERVMTNVQDQVL